MLIPRIIPCLDVRDGRVVKGVRFQNLRDAGDPAALAAEYERQGADELVMLDVSATADGRRAAVETVSALRRRISIPLTVGGGVRSEADAACMLGAGADKVAVNTAAVEDPSLVARLAGRFGSQCVVVAIDAARTPDAGEAEPSMSWAVVVRAGTRATGLRADAWSRECQRLGAGEILLTSIDRDGVGSGYDLDLLRAVRRGVRIPIIASGGAAHWEHLAEGLTAGADAVLAATIFHDRIRTVADVKRDLASAGFAVRAAGGLEGSPGGSPDASPAAGPRGGAR
ncbi:MAG: imidazole glycerol phosphate synthase subunit HisF [Phycisphaeraceae bacterium]|nr:imidazole glycerol phosphate synthase subunit HisF [Phycisphaerae bacterium]MBX3391247.1 imidazole glycerol phosphate synthase subunit HisF [Phycisphaeraceae bacterium]